MIKYLIFLVITLIASTLSFAQTGSTCANPDSINSLPFVKTGLNTGDAGNNYTGTNINTTYMSGDDYVFRYKPASNINIHIKITNVDYAPGIFVIKGCPDSPSAICIARDSSDNSDLEIFSVPLQADSTYYIVVSTHDFAGLTMTTNFNIEVSESHQYDLAIYTFWVPRSSCSLNNDQQVHLEVFNEGYDTIHNFYLNYSVNGGSLYTDYVDTTLAPGDRYYHFFNQHQDMSSVGEYDFTLYSELAGDGNLNNDTLNVKIYHTSMVNTFPYYQDFETSNDWWSERVFYPGHLRNYSTWELGTPNAPIINSAASGTKAWVTSLDSLTNKFEESYLVGPGFDFSNLAQPVFESDIWYETANYDYAILEYSVDSGIHFTTIGTINDGENWYNTPSSSPYQGWTGSSGGWIHVKHEMPNLAGLSKVLFRIRFVGNSTQSEGFAVDNIYIHESPLHDLGVIQILNPVTGCSLSSNENITVKVYNYGLDTIHSFPISYSLDGGTWVTDTIHQAIAFDDTLTYTFQSNIDLSATGTHNIIVKTNLINDDYTTNDSIAEEIINYQKITSYPYIQDFDTDNGNFTTSGLNSSWEWGTPSDSIITNASSGTKCWVTNLSGYSNNPEQSYLYANCFDFSNLKNPKIKLDIWSETLSPSGGQLESTIDTGNSWQVMGVSATIDTNWYSSGYMWIGSSGNWKTVYQKLPTLIGKSDIQFRIKYISGTNNSGLALDNFIICDNPLAGADYTYNGNQISFTDTSYNADSVKYIFSDGTTYTIPNPVYTISADSVKLTLIAYNFCGSDTTTQTIYKTGIKNYNTYKIKIYPNPAKNYLQIKSSKLKIYNCSIFNIYGQMMDIPIKKDKNNLLIYNTTNLQKGIYFIKLRTDKGTIIKKIIKQ